MLAWEWPGNGGSHRSWRSVELRKIFPHFPHQHFLFSTRLQDLYGLAYNFCYNTTTFSKEDQWELGGGQFGALFQVTFYYISIPAIVQRSNSGECVQEGWTSIKDCAKWRLFQKLIKLSLQQFAHSLTTCWQTFIQPLNNVTFYHFRTVSMLFKYMRHWFDWAAIYVGYSCIRILLQSLSSAR